MILQHLSPAARMRAAAAMLPIAVAAFLCLMSAGTGASVLSPPAFTPHHDQGPHAARVAKARELLAAGKAAEAADAALIANVERPDDLDALELLAQAQLAANRMELAEGSIQWLLDMRPDDPRGMLLAAQFRDRIGDAEGASDMVTQVIARCAVLPPACARAFALAASMRRKAGDPAEAQQLAQRAAELLPEDAEIAAELAASRAGAAMATKPTGVPPATP